MPSKELRKAREFEELNQGLVSEEARPAFHFSPRVGWLNDPNGFSYYEGKYHLFYQYHPYSTYWGPMHWGHAVSDDMIHWEYLPAALAPDTRYDGAGCFSGSALTLEDGRHLLMYTGCADHGMDENGRWIQTQNIACSIAAGNGGAEESGSTAEGCGASENSGTEYVKYGVNPVIGPDQLPPGGDPYECRDPYLWTAADGSFRALLANGRRPDLPEYEQSGTQLLLYRSADGFHWEFDKVLFEDSRRIGIMWECPAFFPLGEAYVLMASPMNMIAEEADGSVRFPKGSNVCYITGTYDEDREEFIPHTDTDGKFRYLPVDMGLDFYASQTMQTPDGRTVMIAWMQDPSTSNIQEPGQFRIFGQMTMPRELRLQDGRLMQRPVRELDALRTGEIIHSGIEIGPQELELPEIKGRVLDLDLTIRGRYDEFVIQFAKSDRYHSQLRYRTDTDILTIDRTHSGQDASMTGRRSIRAGGSEGRLHLRILLDRWSAEVFINDGAQVMSATYYTPLHAEKISFKASGTAIIDIKAYRLMEP